ncbi:MAG: hypothetical protein OXE43_01745 [Chloroflexi bacterium]|nr:hypothetical protein [Chloroflexota bacterium]
MPPAEDASLLAPDLEERLARFAPEVRDVISTLHGELWQALDPEVLELCRLRIASLQADEREAARAAPGAPVPPEKAAAISDWPDSPLFNERERACLAFTEQFVGDVAGVSQGDIDALLAHFSPGEVQAFVSALLALDQHQRLALGLRTVLAPQEEPA